MGMGILTYKLTNRDPKSEVRDWGFDMARYTGDDEFVAYQGECDIIRLYENDPMAGEYIRPKDFNDYRKYVNETIPEEFRGIWLEYLDYLEKDEQLYYYLSV